MLLMDVVFENEDTAEIIKKTHVKVKSDWPEIESIRHELITNHAPEDGMWEIKTWTLKRVL